MDARSQDANPYESPTGKSEPVAGGHSSASVLWFLGATFLVSTLMMALGSHSHWSILGVSLYAGLIAVVSLVVYQLPSLVLHRRYPATRLSRVAAGVTFSVAVYTVTRLAIAYGFRGPPGILNLPIAALASTIVDRGITRIAVVRQGEGCE